ncbi:uncharacterized protein LOC142349503 isoform X2 [Convolutriloba macropyga]|uniref:uncharacterized protein LOC142349503 isoform X2 n=1 Tax=Convolutriloba macropyga TaxID=536237 RepID=UPI003F51F92E
MDQLRLYFGEILSAPRGTSIKEWGNIIYRLSCTAFKSSAKIWLSFLCAWSTVTSVFTCYSKRSIVQVMIDSIITVAAATSIFFIYHKHTPSNLVFSRASGMTANVLLMIQLVCLIDLHGVCGIAKSLGKMSSLFAQGDSSNPYLQLPMEYSS